MSNQIFLVASNQPTGQLSHFYVSADNAYVLAGGPQGRWLLLRLGDALHL